MIQAPEPPASDAPDLAPLAELVRLLRGPGGCAWDRKQTLGDVRGYLLEEAHEVADALDRRDWGALEEELGDLLFHVVFTASVAAEDGHFDLARVIHRIHTKMVDRHPHVFEVEQAGTLHTADEVSRAWEERKLQQEKKDRPLLDGVARSVPALLASYRMTQKAAGVGFDWDEPAEVLDKVEEELGELRAEMPSAATKPNGPPGPDLRDGLRAELGDLLFTVANLARKLDIDPEAALAETNLKFRRRFGHVETRLKEQDRRLDQASLDEMDALWNEAKAQEAPESLR